MKKKMIIIMALAIAIMGGGWYGYKEYTRKVKDLKNVKAQVSVDATGLVAAFEKDEAAANALYLGRIMAVMGKVKAVEKNEQGHYTVILGDEGNMSAVRCSMDSIHQEEAANFSAGALVTVKGACTGFNADELLGSDVILNRCVVEK